MNENKDLENIFSDYDGVSSGNNVDNSNQLSENNNGTETPVYNNVVEPESVEETPVYNNVENNGGGITEEEMKELATAEPMENPSAKIVLNKAEEEEEQNELEEDIASVKESLKSNQALKLALILGLLFLIVIIALPYLSKLLG